MTTPVMFDLAAGSWHTKEESKWIQVYKKSNDVLFPNVLLHSREGSSALRRDAFVFVPIKTIIDLTLGYTILWWTVVTCLQGGSLIICCFSTTAAAATIMLATYLINIYSLWAKHGRDFFHVIHHHDLELCTLLFGRESTNFVCCLLRCY